MSEDKKEQGLDVQDLSFEHVEKDGEGADSPEVKGVRDLVRDDVEEQFDALDGFEMKNWIEGEGKNSVVLRELYQRMQALEGKGGDRYAAEVNGVDGVPDFMKHEEGVDDLGRKVIGDRGLDVFMEGANKPYNLFYLDRNLSKEVLEERIAILDDIYNAYSRAEPDERAYLEELINRMFGIPKVSYPVESYLEHLDVVDSTSKSEGAENRNFLFKDGKDVPRVLKISKGRHDIDFTSMLKLMRNMHTLMLSLNKDLETPKGQKLEVRLVADDMLVYKDSDTNYKRIIRQPYAQGTPVKQIPKDVKKTPEFKDAWQTFLAHVEGMREAHGMVLDMTDSGAPFPLNRWTPRGNVANTENVFVKQKEDGTWLFSIIDPDVFDVEEGEHKFDPVEHSRTGEKVNAKVFEKLLNPGRVKTLGWQDKHMKREREA
jgi:hypothetical protein